MNAASKVESVQIFGTVPGSAVVVVVGRVVVVRVVVVVPVLGVVVVVLPSTGAPVAQKYINYGIRIIVFYHC